MKEEGHKFRRPFLIRRLCPGRYMRCEFTHRMSLCWAAVAYELLVR